MMKFVDAIVHAHGSIAATAVVWPPVELAARWFGGATWRLVAGTVVGSFFTGGLVAHHLVRARKAILKGGIITIAPVLLYKELQGLCALWMRQVLKNDAAQAVRAGQLEAFRPAHQALLRGKRRKVVLSGMGALAKPPRCIKCALAPTTPAWKNPMRWQMAITIVAAAAITKTDPLAMAEVASAAMARRGDGEVRIQQFNAAINRYLKMHNVQVLPCVRRTRPTEGLWCPIGGDTALCASERGLPPPALALPTPATMWAKPG